MILLDECVTCIDDDLVSKICQSDFFWRGLSKQLRCVNNWYYWSWDWVIIFKVIDEFCGLKWSILRNSWKWVNLKVILKKLGCDADWFSGKNVFLRTDSWILTKNGCFYLFQTPYLFALNTSYFFVIIGFNIPKNCLIKSTNQHSTNFSNQNSSHE